MGLIRDDFGRITIEERRESFIVHPDDEAWPSDLAHPEFYLADLDDLISALDDLREAMRRGD